jgi:hypothetical protein
MQEFLDLAHALTIARNQFKATDNSERLGPILLRPVVKVSAK